MKIYSHIIIGSGPTGAIAAHSLRNNDVLMLDVGNSRSKMLKKAETEDNLKELILGNANEQVIPIIESKYGLKLKNPTYQFVTKDKDDHLPIISDNFNSIVSFAKGGLANAWGGGAYRFNEKDLLKFPFSLADITPYYNKLSAMLGICGKEDALLKYFGKDNALGALPEISDFYDNFISRYNKKQKTLKKNGIYIGRPRLALQSYNEHKNYINRTSSFIRSDPDLLFNPVTIISKLIQGNELDYKDKFLALSFVENDNIVQVSCKNLRTNNIEIFYGKKLIIAAGTINTSALVLRSNKEQSIKLPLLDNPMTTLPFFSCSSNRDYNSRPFDDLVQCNMIINNQNHTKYAQASFYTMSGPLVTDLIFSIPLPLHISRKLISSIYQSTGFAVLFLEGGSDSKGYIELNNNKINININEEKKINNYQKKLVRCLRELKYLTLTRLFKKSIPGSSIHYAGSLPMKKYPKKFETYYDGKLYGYKHTHIVDGSTFPALPAKNITLTLMANAFRIADIINNSS
jgi:hypothetical protein